MYKDSVEWSGDGAKKERRFLKTPNAYGYFTVNIQPLKNLSVALTGTYTGSMLVGHQKTDDYTFTQMVLPLPTQVGQKQRQLTLLRSFL